MTYYYDSLIDLLDNRQMPDHVKPVVTLGELRALRAEIIAAGRERLRGEVEALPDQFYGPRFRTAVLALLADPAEPTGVALDTTPTPIGASGAVSDGRGAS